MRAPTWGSTASARSCTELTKQASLPRVRRQQPQQHADGGGLARSVRAEEAEQIALGDLQIDGIDRGEPPIALGQPTGAEDDAQVARPPSAAPIRSSSATVTAPDTT